MTGAKEVLLLPGLSVSRETEQLLLHFVELVTKWTKRINLVSAQSLSDIWSRHVLDSAQLYVLSPKSTQHWADLGSGAGFPGIVVSLLALGQNRPLRVTLLESDQRKATFLRAAARELGIAPHIIAARIEHVPSLQADIVSARALAALPLLLGYAHLHLHPSGLALYPKGRSVADEIALARADWHFDLVATPSITDPAAQILQIENIAHV